MYNASQAMLLVLGTDLYSNIYIWWVWYFGTQGIEGDLILMYNNIETENIAISM